MLFHALSYHCLQSWYLAHIKQQKSAKVRALLEAKSQLLGKAGDDTLMFIFWRTADVALFCRSGAGCFVSSHTLQAELYHLQLLPHDIAIQVFHTYRGLMPEMEISSGYGRLYAHGLVVFIARLHGFIATSASNIRNDGTNYVGAPRENLSHKTFSTFFFYLMTRLLVISEYSFSRMVSTRVPPFCTERL